MKKSKIDFKPKYRWSEISDDLQNYFILRGLIGVVLIILVIVVAIVGNYRPIKVFCFLVLGFYILWIGYYLFAVLYGKVASYIGIVESKSGRDHSVTNPITKKAVMDYHVYGRSAVLMSISRMDENGEEITAKFEIPVGYSFKAAEGNQLIVYALKSGVFKKNNNTYTVTNPILVKVYSE